MNQIRLFFSLLVLFLIVSNVSFSQGVAVNTDGSNADNSAMLDVSSNNKGMLVPRVSIADLNTGTPVSTPAVSLLVYNTNVATGVGYYYWDGSKWVRLTIADDLDYVDGNGVATRIAFWSDANTLTSDANLYWDDANNRLGIRTSSPTTPLYLDASAHNGTAMIVDRYASGGVASIQAGPSNEYLMLEGQGTTGKVGINFYSSGDVLLAQGGGNVGIGTTVPSAKFHVDGSVRFQNLGTGAQTTGLMVDASGNVTGRTLNITNWDDAYSWGDHALAGYITSERYLPDDPATSNVDMNDFEIQNVKALQGIDWDDNSGGTDNKYRILWRDGAHQFYNGGVVVGSYGNGTWADLTDGRLIVEERLGVGTISPTESVDITGSAVVSGDYYLNSGHYIGIKGDNNIVIDDANPTWQGNNYGGVIEFRGDNVLNQSKLNAGGLELERDIEVTGRYFDSNSSAGSAGQVLSSTTTGTQWAKAQVIQSNSATVTAGNWYRIASNTGNRADASFTLRDQISGGGHSTMRFHAGVNYGNASGISFNLVSHSIYGSATFTKVRIIRNGTYDGAYLEVYCNRSGSVEYDLYDNFQSSGWIPEDWTAGSVPAGWTTHEYEADRLLAIGASDDILSLTRSGGFGIGTASPSAQFHTTGSVRFANYTNGFLQVDGIGNLSVGTGSDLFTAGDGLSWSGTTLNSIWRENGTSIYNGNSGNVGVGTSSPGQKLEVAGTFEVDNASSGALAHLKGGSDDTSYEWIGFYSGETRQGIMLWDGSWSGAGNRSNEFSITAENGNWLTLTSGTGTSILGGNVGIGTTTPSSKLEVDGWIGRTAHNNGALVGSYNNIASNDAFTNPIYVIGASYKPDQSVLSNMYGIGYTHTNASFVNNSDGSWGMYVAADGDARIWLAASASGDSYFNAGDVGIGTTSPSEKLHVNGGSVYANSNNGEWCELADNVWEGSYARSDSDDGAQGYTTSQYYSGVRGDGPGYMEVDRSIWGDDYYYSEGGTYGRGFESWGSGGSYDEKGGTGVYGSGTNTGVVAFGGDVDYWKSEEPNLQTLFQDGYSSGTGIAASAAVGSRLSGSQFGTITNSKGVGLIASSSNNVSAYFKENTVTRGAQAKLLVDENGNAELAYSVVSQGQKIIISGSGVFVDGMANLLFNPSLAAFIEDARSLSVNITPTEMPDGFWAVTEKSRNGFTAECNESDFSFDFVVIATISEQVEMPAEITESQFIEMLNAAANFEINQVEKDPDGKSMLFTKEERDAWSKQNIQQNDMNTNEQEIVKD
ncbi:MAG: hypothetical protein PF448_04315 [Bacteroidales bacterium]|jgi:hypothetical protein|nr:hypothetical protein [Bacteroidales bacterium]